jgi:hypothetical protein
VIARLRRGETVDVAAEAPPLRAGNDEIGQVGEAIDTVRQTAIRAAVEEARVRQGVNDMFRNLARRNQSLLQRQLSVLDGMERQATDPDVLEELFKMDHLTTRMRRHAEGLIILSGAAPGRSWSAPVKLIDVMRGAVSEVEDYARVTVSTQSRAALAGSAVTDVIHLLAELIENATTLSPPFTQVRVGGETVANGFAIEIEDRGLGMVPPRMQELNERLANPPDLNPANTEQLGLFVVGQLARRHGIRVMLRPSPYGGTTAVALIPLPLLVEEGPAAITAGGRTPAGAGANGNGHGANGSIASGGLSGGVLSGQGPNGGAYGNGTYGNGYAGAAAGGVASGGQAGWPAASSWSAGNGPDGRPQPGSAPYQAPAAYGNGASPATAGYPATAPADQRGQAAEAGGFGPGQQDLAGPPIRIAGGLRPPAGSTGYGTDPAEGGPHRPRHGNDDVPVVTGVPVGRPATPPVPPFDVFTPLRRPEQDYAPAQGDPYQEASPYQSTSPYPGADAYQGGSPYQGTGPYPGSSSPQDGAAYQDPDQLGGLGAGQSAAVAAGAADLHAADLGAADLRAADLGAGDAAGSDLGGGAAEGEEADGDFKGLPRRVRQANLAPQLRVSAASGPQAAPAVPPATAASLTDMRNTLSAMQRGWQQGRSQTQGDTEDGTDGN